MNGISAQHVTCPRCVESCAIVLARQAAEAIAVTA